MQKNEKYQLSIFNYQLFFVLLQRISVDRSVATILKERRMACRKA